MSYPLATQMQWPSLAQDLALLMVPNSPIKGIDDICAAYNITRAELKEILALPHFKALFNQTLDEVKKQGSKAGARYRAMILSISLAEKLFRDAQHDKFAPKESIKLLESLLKMSGLDSDKDMLQVNTQVNVALPIPQGISKVAHCIPAAVTTNGG